MLTYNMVDRAGCGLREHLYRCIRHDIAHGSITAGEKLPSKRALASHLGVSVITVAGAYDQLVAEGYVRAAERRGYFACELEPAIAPEGGTERGGAGDGREGRSWAGDGGASHKCTRFANRNDTSEEDGSENAGSLPSERRGVASGVRPNPPLATPSVPFPTDPSGSAATALFPYAIWAKTMRATLSEESAASLAEAAQAAGSPRLRRAISHWLWESRGMHVDPSLIVVGAGAQVLYKLIVQLLGRDRRIAVEDPGYPQLTRIYRANGVDVAHIPVDAEGIDAAALEACDATVAHVMPSHQFPTGATMSAARRRELLNWTRGGATPGSAPAERYLIEDDYDCELRLAGRPVPTLQSIDAAGRVIYLDTFTKTLGAAFRIAYMVLPAHLADSFHRDLGFYASTVSPVDQLALARFIEQGHYERHVNRLRTHARRTLNALVAALRRHDPHGRFSFEGLGKGQHFVLEVDGAPGASAIPGAPSSTGTPGEHEGPGAREAPSEHEGPEARESPAADHGARPTTGCGVPADDTTPTKGVSIMPMSRFSFRDERDGAANGEPEEGKKRTRFVVNFGAMEEGDADEAARAIARLVGQQGIR